MDPIELVDPRTIEADLLISLMNDAKVRKQLPLLEQEFTEASCRAFLNAKNELWREHGYGPWAIVIENCFAGWGGLQPEQGEADFALVLHPRFWGWGRRIFNKIKAQAFGAMGLESITALLPPGRSNSRAITRLGFIEVGQQTVNDVSFMKFRLTKFRLTIAGDPAR